MTKKYFKYILFSLLISFMCSIKVNAAYCQYEIPAEDNTYFYVRYNIANSTISGIECCHENSKQDSNFTCTSKCSIAGQSFSGGYKLYPILNESLDQYAKFILQNNSCNNILTWYEKENSKSINISYDSQDFINNGAQDLGRVYNTISAKSGSGTSENVDSSKKYKRQIENGDYIQAYEQNGKKIVEVINGKKYEITSASNDLTIEANGEKYVISSVDLGNLFSDKQFYVVKDDKTGTKYYTVDKNYDNFVVRRNDIESNGKVEDLTKICKDKKVKVTLKLLGYALIVAKILVPIILIISGVISFAQSVINAEDEMIKKNVKTLIIKIIGGIIIFLLPSIINIIVGIIEDTNKNSNSDYESCSKCIFEPKKC